MSKPKSIKIDEVEYVRADTVSSTNHDGPIKIVILQRGWVMVGRMEEEGEKRKLHNASVIRVWGTKKGLGEIAASGPTASTVLDPCGGVVEFHVVTVVATIAVDQDKWSL